jgi:hypothetical protein
MTSIDYFEPESTHTEIQSVVRCGMLHDSKKSIEPQMEMVKESVKEPEDVEFIDMRGGDTIEMEGFTNTTQDILESLDTRHELFPTTQITRKFELVSKSNESNAPMNMLFGEGEFLFTKEKMNIYIIADLYTIGGNLYAAKDESQVLKLHYNVYIGDSNKILKGKLGEMKRSLDQRYKLEIMSTSVDFMKFVADNSYIVVKIENDEGTLRQILLESKY